MFDVKTNKKHFPSKTKFSAKQVLELVHGELYGPIFSATSAGNKYFFLLVDDFSRVMRVYMLKNKSKTLDVFKIFRARVEDGPEKRIRVFRTDRGGEFCSKDFNVYCQEAGITRHFTAPYSPQQNGVVERRKRTVVSMARSFLKQMKIPLMFWGKVVRHTVYVLNRLHTRALTGMTPYEAWTNVKPHVDHIVCSDAWRIRRSQVFISASWITEASL